MSKNNTFGKKFILQTLDFLRYKIENDCLTVDEIESMIKVISSTLCLSGTAQDFANFFGKSRENVKVVINRRVISKPERKVVYPFTEFVKAIPDSWKNLGKLGKSNT